MGKHKRSDSDDKENRKHKRSNSDDKENRLARKMRRLMKKFRKYENRGRRSRSSSSGSEEKRGSRKRQKMSNDLNIEELSQSPSLSPLVFPKSVDLDLQLPPNETLSREPMEVTSGRSSPNPFQNPSGNNITTQADISANNQPIIKPSEASSSSGMQNIDSTDQDGIIIEDLDVEILEAIGKRVAEDRILAPAIFKSIAVRLENILKKGLPKEERENPFT
ncbi:uncharacterized protein LOC143904477 [Temnothorax americanus]|uniref:uncharacterized protein LOC143904477 n=1 Tax=Temnothorax americanus TaxID=1964332 RepID=UPI004068D58E